MELVIASSSVAEAGIGCWDLESGAEQLRYKSCASPPHGLACVGDRFLASSQLRESSAPSGSILYWSWSKPQVDVKSFPAEPIKPIAANSQGSYIVGGGQSGDIYIWEVASGRLLKKWHAHYRAITCLVFSEDGSFLISGSEDGCVRIWSLIMIFDEYESQQASHLFLHSFAEHTLRVTDIVIGYGGINATIVSASEDRTCKVWSISRGRMLRNIVFPSVIDAIALDSAEHVFYAGSRDGNIYIAALNAQSPSTSSYGMHIIGSLSDHSKAVTCLAYSTGDLLLSGSEDGVVRVWDPMRHNIVRMFRLAKGPVNNILVVRRPPYLNLGSFSSAHASSRRHGSQLPPLEKYVNSADEDMDNKGVIRLPSLYSAPRDTSYISHRMIENHIKQVQQQGSAAAGDYRVSVLLMQNYEPPTLVCAINEVMAQLTCETSSVPVLLAPFVVESSKLKGQERTSAASGSNVSLYGLQIGQETDITKAMAARTQKPPLSLQIHYEPLACFLQLVRILELPTFILIGQRTRSHSSQTSGGELEILQEMGELLASNTGLLFSSEKITWNPTKASKDTQEPWQALYG